MGYLKIKCGCCGGTWEVYKKLLEYDAARTCPHCDKRIAGSTWRENVLPAYKAMLDANIAIVQDSINHHSAGFEVSYIPNGVFTNAQHGETLNAIEELRSDLNSN